MAEVLFDRKRAIANTAVYAVLLVIAVLGLITRQRWWARALMVLVILWAIGGVTANWRAIRHGFDLERD